MRKPNVLSKTFNWFKNNRLDVTLALLLVTVCGTVSALNMTGYPQRFEDEGTYISQAWAIKEQGSLTHYTYWYDHPPVGWIQIAGYLTLTDALDRHESAITAGREFMIVMHVVTLALMYALARRLRIGRTGAFVGVLLYGLSPLTVEYSRYVLLDNVALPWLIGAFMLALSPKKSVGAAILASVFMAIAVLSKETLLVLVPVILYCLWRNGDVRNRRYTLLAFGIIFVTINATYILYAFLKNELIPGEGHVSLIGTLIWQLFVREGSGSILDSSSSSFGLLGYWLKIDHFLLAAGVVGLIPSLIKRNLRPVGLALAISLAMLLRSGYLPFPYVIVILPFAALCFAGTVDILVRTLTDRINLSSAPVLINKYAWIPARGFAVLALIAMIGVTTVYVAPYWQNKLVASISKDADASSREAVEWIAINVPNTNRMVVESALWTDLESEGFDQPTPVWLYKTETDPAIKSEIVGSQGINYVILNGPTIGAPGFKEAFPIVATALDNGKLVKEFGENNQKILIYEISHDTDQSKVSSANN